MQRLPRIEVRPQGAAAWRALRARPHWLAAIGAVALAYAALVAWAMWNLPLDRALAPLPEPAIVLLDAEDLAEVEQFYLSLDAASRRHRFGFAISDTLIVAHVKNLGGACLAGLRVRRQLVGLAEAHVNSFNGEIAVVLSPEYRGAGHGATLFSAVVSMARQHGAQHLEVFTAGQNRPMQRLAQSFGLRTTSNFGGDWHAAVDLDGDDCHLPSVYTGVSSRGS